MLSKLKNKFKAKNKIDEIQTENKELINNNAKIDSEESESYSDLESESESDSEIKENKYLGEIKHQFKGYKNLTIEYRVANINVVNSFDFYKGNRDIVDNHVKNIYTKQSNIIKRNRNPFISGIITIGELNNKYYILDGQHRVKAIQNLIKNYKNLELEIRFELVKCQQDKDLSYIIKILNNKETTDQKILKLGIKSKLYNYIEKKHTKKIFTKVKNPRPPHVNINHLSKKCLNLGLYKYKFSNVLRKLTEINELYETEYSIEELKFGEKYKITDKMLNKAKKYNFFLGFDRKMTYLDEIKNLL